MPTRTKPIYMGPGSPRIPISRSVRGVYNFMSYTWICWKQEGKLVLYSEESGLGQVRGDNIFKMWEEIEMTLDLLGD